MIPLPPIFTLFPYTTLFRSSYVTSGKITRNSKIRLIRDSVVQFEGEIEALKRFKDDVREVALNYECGITIKRSEEHTSELQSRGHLVCRLLLEKKNKTRTRT